MQRPRVYGDESKFRRAVARYISEADEIVDRAMGVRKRAEVLAEKFAREEADRATSPSNTRRPGHRSPRPGLRLVSRRETPDLDFVATTSGWTEQVSRWMDRSRKAMHLYLQDEYWEVVPVLANGPRVKTLNSTTGYRRYHLSFAERERWLKRTVKELRELQSVVGVSRDVTKAASAPARFEELHASGLVAKKVVNDHARVMRAPRTPKQLGDAIGSAKELTEATLRAALERLGSGLYRDGDELPLLMKKWRKEVGTHAPPDPKGAGVLDNAQAALANLVTFLAQWRNKYGSGHGRADYPPGLAARHARLAADAAETCIRFIVTTMDDLQLLPP